MPNSFSPSKKNNNENYNDSLSFSSSKKSNILNDSLSKELVNFESKKKEIKNPISEISVFNENENENSFDEQIGFKNNTKSTNNESISYTFTDITKKSTNFDKNLRQYLKGDNTCIFNINESLDFNDFLCCKQNNLFIDKTIKKSVNSKNNKNIQNKENNNNNNKENQKKNFYLYYFILLIIFYLILIFLYLFKQNKDNINPKIIKVSHKIINNETNENHFKYKYSYYCLNNKTKENYYNFINNKYYCK